MSPLALVSGASSGSGKAFAERLAADGYDLIVVGRRKDRLTALAASLPSVALQVVAADLSTDEGIDTVAELCASQSLTMLVNNAGVAHYMPMVELPAEKTRELLHVKVVAPTMLTRAALSGMIGRGAGTIVNVAGMIAFSGPAPAAPPQGQPSAPPSRSSSIGRSRPSHSRPAGTGSRTRAPSIGSTSASPQCPTSSPRVGWDTYKTVPSLCAPSTAARQSSTPVRPHVFCLRLPRWLSGTPRGRPVGRCTCISKRSRSDSVGGWGSATVEPRGTHCEVFSITRSRRLAATWHAWPGSAWTCKGGAGSVSRLAVRAEVQTEDRQPARSTCLSWCTAVAVG